MSSVAARALLRGAVRGRQSPLVRCGRPTGVTAVSELIVVAGNASPLLPCLVGAGGGASVPQAVSVRHFGRKGGRMGHHLETLEEMAHRGEHLDAVQRRKKKKAKRGKGGGSDGGDAAEAEAATAAAPAAMEDVSLEVEEDASETAFDHGADEEALLPDAADVKARMMRVVSSIEESFKAIRGAEPTPELFESIQVEAYGAKTPLSGVAQVVIVGPNRATLTCYDPGTADAVRDAVRDAGMNFNPQVEEGGVVVVPIPKVSMETRQRLAKQIGKAAEAGRQRVRRIRRAAQDVVKEGKDGKLSGVGEDEAFRAGKDIDKVTEEAISALDNVVEKKQASIMAI